MGQENFLIFTTLSDLTSATDIPSDANAVVVGQLTTSVDCSIAAAVYIRSPEALPGRPLATQDHNGTGDWWTIHPDYLTLEAAGAPTVDATDNDCFAALQLVLDYLGDTTITQACLKLGERDYVIGTLATLPPAVGKDFTIEGRGMGVSRFVVPSTNRSGAIAINFNDHTSQFTGKDFKIEAQGAGCGTALLINCSVPGDAHQVMVTLCNVQVRGGDSGIQNYFLTGIDLTGSSRPNLQNVTISGVFGPSFRSNNIDASPAYLMQTGLVMNNCYSPHLENVFIYSASLGISHVIGSGPAIQGMGITNCLLINVKQGLLNQGCPDIFLSTVYINFRDYAIKFSGANPGSLNIKAYDIICDNNDYNSFAGSIGVTGGTTTLTVASTPPVVGYLGAGQTIFGAGVAAGTQIIMQLTGTPGGPGTYSINLSQIVSSETMTAFGSPNGICYDIISQNVNHLHLSGIVFKLGNNQNPNRYNVWLSSEMTDGPNQNVLINDSIFASPAISAIWITESTEPDVTISDTNQFSGTYSSKTVKDDSGQAVIAYFNQETNNADVVESQASGSALGPVRSVYRNNPSGGTNGDFIGDHIFEANDVTGTRQTFARVLGQIDDATAVSGTLQCGISVAGAMTTFLKLKSSAVTVGNGSTPVEPAGDNAQSLGASGTRWSAVYATKCFVGSGGTFWTSGSGNPNNMITAPIGSLYTDTGTSSGHTLWVKQTTSGNTGWVGK